MCLNKSRRGHSWKGKPAATAASPPETVFGLAVQTNDRILKRSWAQLPALELQPLPPGWALLPGVDQQKQPARNCRTCKGFKWRWVLLTLFRIEGDKGTPFLRWLPLAIGGHYRILFGMLNSDCKFCSESASKAIRHYLFIHWQCL